MHPVNTISSSDSGPTLGVGRPSGVWMIVITAFLLLPVGCGSNASLPPSALPPAAATAPAVAGTPAPVVDPAAATIAAPTPTPTPTATAVPKSIRTPTPAPRRATPRPTPTMITGGFGDPEDAIKVWVIGQGFAYAHDCDLEPDDGYCSHIWASPSSSARVYTVGPVGAEPAYFLLVRHIGSLWYVAAAASFGAHYPASWT
jgi:hypothetical protein